MNIINTSPNDVEGINAELTVIIASNPSVLSKSFHLDQEGQLVKEPGGRLFQGRAEVCGVKDLSDFADFLASLKPDEALTYGCPRRDDVAITTSGTWERMGRPDNPIPRTAEQFRWPEGRGILMLDYDPEDGATPLSATEVVATLRAVAPALDDVEMLTWSSASTHIVNSETGQVLKGAAGLRVYIMVEDAADIERAGRALYDRLWLEGHGYYKISKSGALLDRTIIDQSVWQTNRLDFAAGAKCEAPLVQRRGKPQLVSGILKAAETRLVFPDLSRKEEAALSQRMGKARAALAEEAAEVRKAWIEHRAKLNAGDKAGDVDFLSNVRREVRMALEARILPRSWVLHVVGHDGIREVTVADVLADPKTFDRCQTLDPVEPDYDSGREVGMLFLDGGEGSRRLHSFARGGQTYRLAEQGTIISFQQGSLDKVVLDTLTVLKAHDQFFDLGDVLAHVEGGHLKAVTGPYYEQMVSPAIRYLKPTQKGLLPIDPPPEATKRIMAMGRVRKLKPLIGVISAPTVRLNGTILDKPGYDAETKLYLNTPDHERMEPIPREVTNDDLRLAFEALMKPFREFPTAEPHDRGALLAALLTATVRRVLPSAPAFAFDAPTQGSGKTLLARCTAILAGDLEASVLPPLQGRDAEEETRKRLLSALRAGSPVMIWDNIMGVFNSAALAASLTSSTYTDRVLGVSENATMPNAMLQLFSGNNFKVKGDMSRRVIPCRIDTEMERPIEREFELDPLRHVRDHRQEMIASALILVRASMQAHADGRIKRAPALASFEDWDALVRCTVRWVNQEIASGEYADPVIGLREAVDDDPEAQEWGSALKALWAIFGYERFTARDVLKAMPSNGGFRSTEANELREAMESLLGADVRLSANSVGQMLGYRKDRVIGGLSLCIAKGNAKEAKTWELAKDGQTGADIRRKQRRSRLTKRSAA